MRFSRPTIVLSTLASALFCSTAANADPVDISPPLPNVLLLIDTSGSMENMIDGKRPEDAGAACKPGIPGTPTTMNRWATLLSVLTGSIDNFSCQAINRSSAGFKDEYKFGSSAPYDADYYLPFHRVLSNGCAVGPGTMGASWADWPTSPFNYHSYDDVSKACVTPFSQQADGILDVFNGRVRFGLMTFDSFPHAGTGASSGSINAATGVEGMWSYYKDWNGGGTPAKGNPPECSIENFEVGARNPAAPPWEGKLTGFGQFTATSFDTTTDNDRIQQSLLAMRPYGATPLAAMLDDARYFLWGDKSKLGTKDFGPAEDPFVGGGCRKSYIIVLSDGEPNLDMRPSCATGTGVCPYPDQPYEVTRALHTSTDPAKRPVDTFVVGFGLSTAAGMNCDELSSADLTSPTGVCQTTSNTSLKACCTLGRMAFEGGTEKAYFADDPSSLKTQLSKILGAIASGSTSRTLPVFAASTSTSTATGAGSTKAPAASYQFASSFSVPLGTGLWSGNLERKRYACKQEPGEPIQAVLQDFDPKLGDDFAGNLNASTGQARRFFTVLGDAQAGNTKLSAQSIRPKIAADDGLGQYKGTATLSSDVPLEAATFVSTVSAQPLAMGISPGSPPSMCSTRLGTSNATQCASYALNWTIGGVNATLPETRDPAYCAAGMECSKMGAIYHASPATVGVPHDYLRDESYSQFAASDAAQKRALMLYAATVDGQLHAFKVSPNDKTDTNKVDELANNELWSFIPPAVLPSLLGSYDRQALLLDGSPIVKDVVFERSQSQAQKADASWHTVLVASGGAGGAFYYALDITDPNKPKFLWQLSTDSAGTSLFGKTGGTPAIATIALKKDDARSEVAVAILPGGAGSTSSDGACDRKNPDWGNVGAPARKQVRCWEPGPSRSLTVVRIDTGEVLMNFRADPTKAPAGLKTGTSTRDVDFDSPITGVPVPYPALPGQVANRVYVGDADGTLWRVDLSSADKSKWHVDLAWDAYTGQGAKDGQPIETPPIVSVDTYGDNVVLFSTGDQEQFTANTVSTFAWSITDKPRADGSGFKAVENWSLPFKNGERVTGPMSLFDSSVYFATFRPNSGTMACSDGNGSLWGVDYVKAEDVSGVKTPLARLQDPDDGVVKRRKDFDDGSLIFGVSVMQTPSCTKTDTYPDPYMGARTSVAEATGGTFQLVYQTGKGGSAAEGGGVTRTSTVDLPSPRRITRIDSWASVIE